MLLDGKGGAGHAALSTAVPSDPGGRFFCRLFKNPSVKYWWKPSVAFVVMLLSMMAIVLILVTHQKRPLPTWPFSITLNSLISIMVTILKSSMMTIIAAGLVMTKWLWFEKPRVLSDYNAYDQGSQDPLTAAQLLWILRGRQIMASIALVVIIAAVAIDPFTQQVIHYIPRSEVSGTAGNATIPRTSVYSDAGPHIGAGENSLGHLMLAAIMAGFWTPGSDAYTISASNCITGNCTFHEPYRTVGICSMCTDETAQISGSYDGRRNFNYSTPTGTTLSVDGSTSENWIVGNATESSSNPGPPGYLAAREFVWTNSTKASHNCEESSCSNVTSCQGTGCPVTAAVCYLYPCINTYTATLANGVLDENLVSSIPMPYSDSDICWTSLRKDCLTPADWDLLSAQGFHRDDNPGSDYLLYCNDSYPAYTDITDACVYDFAEISYNSFNYWFSESAEFNKGLFLAGQLEGDDPLDAEGPTDLYYLYNWGSLTMPSLSESFANIAKTMTTRVRLTNEGNYSTPAQGLIFFSQTVIKVQWQWLTLPAALVILTILFIINVFIQTTIHDRRVLDSPLSRLLLLYGVAGRVSDHRNMPESPEGQEKAEKKENTAFLQLKETEHGILKLTKL